MIKKIIIGTVITAFLIFGVTGSLYAYQEEPAEKNSETAENRFQHDNSFRRNEEGINCEPEKNYYSYQHKYNYQNENCGDDNGLEYKHNNRQSHSCQNFNSESKGNFSLRQNRNNNKNNS